MKIIKLYFYIININIKKQFVYRNDALIGIFNQFTSLFIELIAMYFLFLRFETIGGWYYNEVFLTYGVINLSFSFAEMFMRGFENELATLIKTGTYDRYLVRPISTIIQISAFHFQGARVGRALLSFGVLAYGIYLNNQFFDLRAIFVVILALSGGICLYFSLYIFTGILAFKFKNNPEFMSIFIHGSVMSMQYPLNIFPKGIKYIFIYIVPVFLISYYPVAIILEKITVNDLFYFTPIVGYIFLFIAIIIFLKVEKNYLSTGN